MSCFVEEERGLMKMKKTFWKSMCKKEWYESLNSTMAKLTVTTNQNKPVVIDDTSADPKQWVTFSDNTNGINVRLYEASKSNIYNSKGWLTDSGIHAAQQLLKIQFPHIDGLNDSDIIKADLVTPAISEFIQIVNTGMHWICLLGTLEYPSGFVKLYLVGLLLQQF